LRTVYDQSALVQSALGGVARAVLLGALFVVTVLFVLLGDARAALIVTMTIPMSIALAGILLQRLNVGLNTMTLGGLAIAVGLLVDAAIIVTENIVHRLAGTPREQHRDVAVRAATEVGRPIAFATVIVIAVFLPLFMLLRAPLKPGRAARTGSQPRCVSASALVCPLRPRSPRSGVGNNLESAAVDDPYAHPPGLHQTALH
jgi:Cu/Ag efflux pump CusA